LLTYLCNYLLTKVISSVRSTLEILLVDDALFIYLSPSLTVSDIEAVLMPKTTFLPTPFVFDLKFEGHAIGM